MSSLFPGMDPFIEEQRWRSFHTNLIVELQDQLVPQVRPRYTILVEEYVYVDRGIYPDLSIKETTIRAQTSGSPASALLHKPVDVRLPMPREERQRFIEIRETRSRDLVAVVEVLSSSNKQSGSIGRQEYLKKRDEILVLPVHLVEIDLLRAGDRLPMSEEMPSADYYAIVSRAARRPTAEVWPISLRDPLPVIPVPLAGNDADAQVDLQRALCSVYDRAGFDYALDYSRPCKPALAPEDEAWVRSILPA